MNMILYHVTIILCIIIHYANMIIFFKGYSGFDLDNVGKGKGGGSCTAAAFLKVRLMIFLNNIYI